MALLIAPLAAQEQGKSAVPPLPGKSAVPSPPAKKDSPAAAPATAPVPAAPAQTAPQPTAPAPSGPVQDDNDPRIAAAVARAMRHCISSERHKQAIPLGESALMVLAMAKAKGKFEGVLADNDPVYTGCLAKVRLACEGKFQPYRRGGPDIYEAGVVAMALGAIDPQLFAPEIKTVMEYTVSRQLPNGSWSYDHVTTGDASMTQYALLGLWEAADGAGLAVPKVAWDKAAQWLLQAQNSDGGFTYHPHEQAQTQASYHTMTVGSLGSLYICRDHLPGGQRRNTKGALISAVEEEVAQQPDNYKPQVEVEGVRGAINRAMEWVNAKYTIDKATGHGDSGGGQWTYYYLYALERAGTLSDQRTIAGHDWYAEGAQFLLSKQRDDGSWGNLTETSFAVLFLIRSTKITIIKHRQRLGRGTLVSGRILPKNLADMEQEGGQIVQRAIRDKTGNLLDLIAGTKPDLAEGAARGLLEKLYEKDESTATIDAKQWKKMLQEDGFKKKNSEAIKLALKGLARTGDYRVVPLLVDGMYYEDDEEVQLAARDALCLISRRFEGAYTGQGVQDWQNEIDKWVAWYKSVRPEADLEDEVDLK